MYTCFICRFDVDLDDVQLRFVSGKVVCVRCFAKEIQDEHPTPKYLMKEIALVAANA